MCKAAQNAQALRVFRQRIEQLEAQRAEVEGAIETLRLAADRLAQKYPGAGREADA